MAYIFVIEDDDRIRTTIREVLEHAGYEVIDAPNGDEGIELFHNRPVDIYFI